MLFVSASVCAFALVGAVHGKIVQLEVFKEDGCQPSELKARELYPLDECIMMDGARWCAYFTNDCMYTADDSQGGPYWKKVYFGNDGGLETTFYADSACTLEEDTHPLAVGAPGDCSQSYISKGFVMWTEVEGDFYSLLRFRDDDCLDFSSIGKVTKESSLKSWHFFMFPGNCYAIKGTLGNDISVSAEVVDGKITSHNHNGLYCTGDPYSSWVYSLEQDKCHDSDCKSAGLLSLRCALDVAKAAYKVAPVNTVHTSPNPFDQPCEVCQGELGTDFVSENGAVQDDYTCFPFLTGGERKRELMRCPEPGTFTGSLRLRPAGLQIGAGKDSLASLRQDMFSQDTVTVHVEGNTIPSGSDGSRVVRRQKMDVYTEPVTQCVRGNGMPLDTRRGISIRLEEHDWFMNDHTDSVPVSQTVLERIRQTIENGTVQSVTLVAQFQFDRSNFQALLESEGLLGVVSNLVAEGLCISALDVIPVARVSSRVARVGSKVARRAYQRMAKDSPDVMRLLRKLDEDVLEPADEAAALVARRQEKGDSLALQLSESGVEIAIEKMADIMSLTDHVEFCLVDAISKGKTTYKFKYVIEPAPSELADYSCELAEQKEFSSSNAVSIPSMVLMAVAMLHFCFVLRAHE